MQHQILIFFQTVFSTQDECSSKMNEYKMMNDEYITAHG